MKKLTKNEINWIKRLAVKGTPYSEIAKKTGIAYQSVRYHASRAKNGEPVKKKVAKKKAVKKANGNVVNSIHRKGNEIHNVDVTDQAVIIPPVADNDVPMVAPEKESSGEAVLWLLVSGVVFVLVLAIANM